MKGLVEDRGSGRDDVLNRTLRLFLHATPRVGSAGELRRVEDGRRKVPAARQYNRPRLGPVAERLQRANRAVRVEPRRVFSPVFQDASPNGECDVSRVILEDDLGPTLLGAAHGRVRPPSLARLAAVFPVVGVRVGIRIVGSRDGGDLVAAPARDHGVELILRQRRSSLPAASGVVPPEVGLEGVALLARRGEALVAPGVYTPHSRTARGSRDVLEGLVPGAR